MRVNIDGLTVYFPYPRIYPEQYEYMCELKKTLDARGHAILEMPTGTGKTVTLLSFITSYHLTRPDMAKLIYCTRTVNEMEKVLEELRVVVENRDKLYAEDNMMGDTHVPKMLALGLTTRRNLCLHETVAASESREEADASCRALTASWVRSSAIQQGASPAPNGHSTNPNLCEYYEGYQTEGADSIIPAGIYTLDDLMAFGRKVKWCPYYTARHSLSSANVIVYNYQYLIDPKISSLISKGLARESIVVFDEAHNIDNICIDALSVNLRDATLRKAIGNLTSLKESITAARTRDHDRLQKEYKRLVTGLSTQGIIPQNHVADFTSAAPTIPADIVEESVPGNIRKAEHFVLFLRRLVQYLRAHKMRGTNARQEQPAQFLHEMRTELQEDIRPLRFCSDRLKSLLQTLRVVEVSTFTPLQIVADFATLLGTYGHTNSFGIVYEPVDDRLPHVSDPVLQLACFDASLAMKPVFQRFQSVILTSGTISPMPLYSRILGFEPATMRSLTMSLQRQAMCPLIVSRGPDQIPVTSKNDTRFNPSVVGNYGKLAAELSAVVPDGLVVFFTSYIYMEKVISMWHESGIIDKLLQEKLIYIETPDPVESAFALDRFRQACDTGRGAVFLCVARGKVAEGIDFDRHYGRAVLVIGIPFQYTESRVLRARLEFLRTNLHIRESDFLSFDAMRQTAQCAGRVIRNKNDYGVVVFADRRYVRADKKNKLPKWILDLMPDSHIDLDSTSAMALTRMYMREMAQPAAAGEGESALLTEEQVAAMSEQRFSKKSVG